MKNADFLTAGHLRENSDDLINVRKNDFTAKYRGNARVRFIDHMPRRTKWWKRESGRSQYNDVAWRERFRASGYGIGTTDQLEGAAA